MSNKHSIVIKTICTLSAVVFFGLAFFNARIAFGSHSIDCLDTHSHLIRFKTPNTIIKNDYIVFIAPEKLKEPFANHLFIKKIGAVAGDRITVKNNLLFINGDFITKLDRVEKAAQILGVSQDSFEREEIVPAGYVFAMGTKPRSYDSRYWGFLPISSVIGSAYPLI